MTTGATSRGFDAGCELTALRSVPRLVLHHIDVLNDRFVSGWCLHRLMPWHSVELTIQIGNREPVRIRCNEFRKDVIDAGLQRKGICGFTHVFDPPLDRESDVGFHISAGLPPRTLVQCQMSAIEPVLNPPRPIVFVHIPKTAGTSFNNYVRGWFEHDAWHNHIEVLPAPDRLRAIQPGHYAAGHLPLYRLAESVPDFGQVDLHTFLREPLAQLHSHIAWLKGIGQQAEFLKQHPAVVQELATRMQTMSLSTPAALKSLVNQLSGFELDFFDNIQVRYLLGHRPERVTAADLAEACNNLSLFRTVGITEQYVTSTTRFAEHYGRATQSQSSRHNPSRVVPLFDRYDPSIQEALKPLVVHDLALYQTALDALQEKQTDPE